MHKIGPEMAIADFFIALALSVGHTFTFNHNRAGEK